MARKFFSLGVAGLDKRLLKLFDPKDRTANLEFLQEPGPRELSLLLTVVQHARTGRLKSLKKQPTSVTGLSRVTSCFGFPRIEAVPRM